MLAVVLVLALGTAISARDLVPEPATTLDRIADYLPSPTVVDLNAVDLAATTTSLASQIRDLGTGLAAAAMSSTRVENASSSEVEDQGTEQPCADEKPDSNSQADDSAAPACDYIGNQSALPSPEPTEPNTMPGTDPRSAPLGESVRPPVYPAEPSGATATPMGKPEGTPAPTITSSITPTVTPTTTPTATPTVTSTATPTITSTVTTTMTPGATSTPTPTAITSATPTATPVAALQASPTPTPTNAPTPAAIAAGPAGVILPGGIAKPQIPSYPVYSPPPPPQSYPFNVNLPQSLVAGNQVFRLFVPVFTRLTGATPPSKSALGPTPPMPSVTPRPPLAPAATATATPTPILPPSSPPTEVFQAIAQQPFRSVDKQSKIGLGVYSDGGGYALNEMFKARPGVVLLMDPKPEFAREVRGLLPKASIIGRRFVQYQPLDNPEVRGAAFADHVAQLAVPLKGTVDGWMSYNEPIGRGDVAGFKAYNTFQVAFAKRLQGTYGIGAVAGNDPPGAVDIPEYPRYFGEAIRISKFFGIHAYSSPDSRSLREPDAQWFSLRYRKIHAALQEAGIKSGPFVLTEVGLAKGWREMGTTTESVVADLAWLADESSKDDYVLGFAAFGVFSSVGWDAFDLGGTPILDVMGRYDPANPPRLPATPARPVPDTKKK